jgi:hypothetical protein
VAARQEGLAWQALPRRLLLLHLLPLLWRVCRLEWGLLLQVRH